MLYLCLLQRTPQTILNWCFIVNFTQPPFYSGIPCFPVMSHTVKVQNTWYKCLWVSKPGWQQDLRNLYCTSAREQRPWERCLGLWISVNDVTDLELNSLNFIHKPFQNIRKTFGLYNIELCRIVWPLYAVLRHAF